MNPAERVENINPYREGEKSGQVEEMFDSIAPAYDFMNGAMSFGLCRRWRNKALDHTERLLDGMKPAKILDVATGTGDVAFALAQRYGDARIQGIDLSEGMLDKAREKMKGLREELSRRIAFEKGDSLDLSYGDASFDLVTVAYGVRNFADLEKGLSEMARVLRPGGVLCIIELSVPRGRVTGTLYKLYTRSLIPLAGKLVSGDHRAYTYLPQSIAAVPQRDDMTALMRRAGLSDCEWKELTFGTVSIYTGRKAENK